MVKHLVHPWRAMLTSSASDHDAQGRKPVWKDVRWAMLCPKERLRKDQEELLEHFLALHPNLAHAYELVQRFRTILRHRLSEDFDRWLEEAQDSGFAPFQRLAKTLAADRAAVLAAVELEWSTGQVEGHINRVKLMNRLGY